MPTCRATPDLLARLRQLGLLDEAAPKRASGRVTEADFTEAVIQRAQQLGWRVARFRTVRVQRKNGSVYYETPVQADGKGWPDLFMVRGFRVLAVELKVGKNRPTAAQMEWLDVLERAGVEIDVWTPADWPAIDRTLAVPHDRATARREG